MQLIDKLRAWLFNRYDMGGHVLMITPSQCEHLFAPLKEYKDFAREVSLRQHFMYGMVDLDEKEPSLREWLDERKGEIKEVRKGYDMALCHTYGIKFLREEDMVQFKLTFL